MVLFSEHISTTQVSQICLALLEISFLYIKCIFSQENMVCTTRAVYRSVRVGFVPDPEPTCRNRVGKKCTHCRPAGVMGPGRSDHQRVAGRSVIVIDLRRRRGNGEKNTDPAKISLDSMRFRQIWRKSHRI